MKRLAKATYLPNLNEIRSLLDRHRKEYNDEFLRQHAKQDAEQNIPSAGSKVASPFELQLKSAAASLASEIGSKFKASLEILDAKIKADAQYAKNKLLNTKENIESMYTVGGKACENGFGLTTAHKDYETAESRYNDYYLKYGRAPIAYVPHWLYLIFAFLIFIGEIPLNALVFQIFGENQIMTWVMAFIIGLAIPLTAHFIGIKLREHADGFSWPNAIKGLGAFGLLTIALYGLSIMRQTYLGEFKEELGLTDVLVESSFLFFWLNMAVFTAAIVVSYLAHDSSPGFEAAKVDHCHSRRKLERLEKKRVKQLVKNEQARAHALNQANRDYRDDMLKVVMLKGIYDQILKEGQEQERRCLHRLQMMLAVYRHENLRSRANGATLGEIDTKLDFPLTLSVMKEKLTNEDGDEQSNMYS